MSNWPGKYLALLFWGALFAVNSTYAQVDTLRVMAYNVLYYGDVPPCQGGHMASHNYLKTIVACTAPDLLGLEKMAAIPMYPADHSGTAPAGFADSILQFALNAAFPGRYAYCTYTNTSGADNISVLFYNKEKLGFAGITASYVNTTDFNTYKLYYLSPLLATAHDTVFLYITLNHTQSGSGSSSEAARAAQIAGEMAQLHLQFTELGNFINMGDFNTHNSMEACYQTLVAPSNPAFRFNDPPFSVDGIYTYPADWDSNPSSYAGSLTTSTRLSGSVPNSCGTSGGGKSWYDHLFLSDAIVNNALGIGYIPHSYRTLGNDGSRVGISVNDLPANTSAPAAVIDAIFQMSNKYPIMADFEINPPVLGLTGPTRQTPEISVTNPVTGDIVLTLDNDYLGKELRICCMDVSGRCFMNQLMIPANKSVHLPFDAAPGIYYLSLITGNGNPINKIIIIK